MTLGELCQWHIFWLRFHFLCVIIWYSQGGREMLQKVKKTPFFLSLSQSHDKDDNSKVGFLSFFSLPNPNNEKCCESWKRQVKFSFSTSFDKGALYSKLTNWALSVTSPIFDMCWNNSVILKDALNCWNPNKCSFLSRTFVSVFYGEKNTFLFSRTFDCSCPVWTLMRMLAVTDWTRRRWTPQADRLLLRITEGMIKHHPHYDDHHHHHHHHHHSHPQMWVPESIPIWPWEICLLSWWNHIQLLESTIPAPAVSQKASSDDISGTKRGTIDPLVSKRPEKSSE